MEPRTSIGKRVRERARALASAVIVVIAAALGGDARAETTTASVATSAATSATSMASFRATSARSIASSGATSTGSIAGSAATRTATIAGRRVAVHGELFAIVLDYGLPGHPGEKGQSALGAIGRAWLEWAIDRHVALEVGAMGRLPFALELDPEIGALPILALSVRPLGDDRALLRVGSLDIRHGYHPAVVDEARYEYGRDYSALYRRSLAPEVERDLAADPWMPAEHGAQARVRFGLVHAEGFLDWQLVETAKHREKFAVGLLGGISHTLGDLSLQLRLVHYGGELYTKGDPVRFAGLDPVRQPLTLAAVGVARPLAIDGVLALEVPITYVRGRVAQAGGEAPSWHHGVELGVESVLLDHLRLGWRWWLPIDRDHGWVSEDGDPIYAGRRSHRVRLALSECYGPAVLSGRLDLVFADGASQVEYLTVTTLGLALEHVFGAREERLDESCRRAL